MPNSQPSSPRGPLHHWLIDQALPLWAETGWDASCGLFVERLDLAGRPGLDAPRRAMVQARQIFVFCLAERRRWSLVFRDRLLPVADNFVRRFHAVDGAPGWIFSVDRSGRPIDGRRDLYGHAFVLLALAHVAQATGERRFLALADETLNFLDRAMGASSVGYVDALPPPKGGSLRQNPHMHLLEALLALHEASPERGYLDRAATMVDLLSARLLHGGVLVEHFDADWTPRGGPDHSFEPGHHFEWAWLLTRFARLAGCAVPEVADLLWRSGLAHGVGADLTIFDETSPARGPLRRSTRLWPYAEAAKAAGCLAAPAPDTPSPGDFLDTLHARFLVPAFSGCWIDHFDANGTRMTDSVPASSLYHIASAADDASGSDQAP